ncbi:ATP-binding protein [Microbacterium sp. LRZ72]|uniref:ATP-binding protein n=1 Tax=Microbacterium sp. LRZ72 TaxID=2942481 RepID=UPI0029A7D84D|nr:ATP-binding protein [Microbacterium sp. LRZ72]MDX2377111.1 ATP-binding protein [Microbacterium sp. LRZ72]
MTDGERVRVEGIADAAFVDRVHVALEQLGRDVPGLSDEDHGLFALAVGEIAANVAAHAVGAEGSPVHVSLALGADEVTLSAVFVDDAVAGDIDLAGVSMPAPEAESGRGLAIAVAAMDEFVYRAEPGGAGNRWELRRRRR